MEFRLIDGRARRHVTVPIGAWFVTHRLLQEEIILPGQSHLRYGDRAKGPEQRLITIGSAVRDIVLVSEKHARYFSFERHLFWSERPFAVHVRTPQRSWILLPREVGSKGITARTPAAQLPEFIESTALPHQKAPYLWARLTDVAALAGRDPLELLERHLSHFHAVSDYVPGIHLLIAPNEEAARQKTTFARVNSLEEMVKVARLDPATIWVRKRFTITVLTLEALAYPVATTTRPSHVAESRDPLPSNDSA